MWLPEYLVNLSANIVAAMLLAGGEKVRLASGSDSLSADLGEAAFEAIRASVAEAAPDFGTEAVDEAARVLARAIGSDSNQDWLITALADGLVGGNLADALGSELREAFGGDITHLEEQGIDVGRLLARFPEHLRHAVSTAARPGSGLLQVAEWLALQHVAQGVADLRAEIRPAQTTPFMPRYLEGLRRVYELSRPEYLGSAKNVYVRRDVEIRPYLPGALGQPPRMGEPERSSWDAVISLCQDSRVAAAVLGTAGQGKSYSLWTAAVRLSDQVNGEGPSKVPLFLPCSNLARTLREQPGLPMARVIADELLSLAGIERTPESRRWMESILESTECVLLLDGLDEATNVTDRSILRRSISDFVTSFAGSVLLSSRYDFWTSIGVDEIHLLPLTREQVDHYLDTWNREAGVDAKHHVDAIPADARTLYENPLMLSWICALSRSRTEAPDSLADLYEGMAFLLTSALWRRAELHEDEVSQVLDQISVVAFRAATNREGWRNEILPQDLLADTDGRALLRLATVTSGGLLTRANAQQGGAPSRTPFRFIHRTMHEYLAARAIWVMDRAGLRSARLSLADVCWRPSWHNALSFLQGVMPVTAGNILYNEWCRHPALNRALFAAIRCYGDDGFRKLTDPLRTRILTELMRSALGSCLSERGAAVQALLSLGLVGYRQIAGAMDSGEEAAASLTDGLWLSLSSSSRPAVLDFLVQAFPAVSPMNGYRLHWLMRSMPAEEVMLSVTRFVDLQIGDQEMTPQLAEERTTRLSEWRKVIGRDFMAVDNDESAAESADPESVPPQRSEAIRDEEIRRRRAQRYAGVGRSHQENLVWASEAIHRLMFSVGVLDQYELADAVTRPFISLMRINADPGHQVEAQLSTDDIVGIYHSEQVVMPVDRVAALFALGKAGDERTPALVMDYLRHRLDPVVAESDVAFGLLSGILVSLAEVGSPDARRLLLTALRKEPPWDVVADRSRARLTRVAADVIRIQPKGFPVEELTALLDDPDATIAVNGAVTLIGQRTEIADVALYEHIKDSRPGVARMCVAAIVARLLERDHHADRENIERFLSASRDLPSSLAVYEMHGAAWPVIRAFSESEEDHALWSAALAEFDRVTRFAKAMGNASTPRPPRNSDDAGYPD